MPLCVELHMILLHMPEAHGLVQVRQAQQRAAQAAEEELLKPGAVVPQPHLEENTNHVRV